MSIELLTFHPLANLFPLMEGREFDDLVASIKQSGLREAIIIHEGMILDGRNRYRACKAAGVPARLDTFGLGDPVAFVVDKNMHRRHLNESQRALIAAQLLMLKKVGDNQHTKEPDGFPYSSTCSTRKIAELLNVNKDTVTLARRVLAEGTPDEIEAIRNGELRVSRIGNELRHKRSPEERAAYDPDAKRQQTRLLNATIWGNLREALKHLQALPLPAEVARIARGRDRGLVDRRLDKSIKWLEEFRNAWTSSGPGNDQAVDQDEPADRQAQAGADDAPSGDHHADARAGDEPAGA